MPPISLSKYLNLAPPHGASAPSLRESVSSGTTSSGSTSNLVPSPVQTGQAPYGELKEKSLGTSSVKLIPQSLHAIFSEN